MVLFCKKVVFRGNDKIKLKKCLSCRKYLLCVCAAAIKKKTLEKGGRCVVKNDKFPKQKTS